MLLRHLIITSFFKNKCYRVFFITSLRVLLRHFVCGHPTWKPGGGKNASNLRGRKFIGTNPRGVHAASRGEIWRVEIPLYRGSNTTTDLVIYTVCSTVPPNVVQSRSCSYAQYIATRTRIYISCVLMFTCTYICL